MEKEMVFGAYLPIDKRSVGRLIERSFVLPIQDLEVMDQVSLLEKEIAERKESLQCREEWLNNPANTVRTNFDYVARFVRAERGEIDLLALELADLKRRCSDV